MSAKTKAPKRLQVASEPKAAAKAAVPRVLFVDDQPELPHGIIRLLPCRIEAAVVTSGLRAIRELERATFDLVVADLKMPGLCGSDLLILIAERWPKTRRILLTGHTSGHLLERASAYADCVVDKILDPEIVCETICRFALNPRRQ